MGHLCLIMGGTFWNGEGARGALAPPKFLTFAHRYFARMIDCFPVSHTSLPNHISILPPLHQDSGFLGPWFNMCVLSSPIWEPNLTELLYWTRILLLLVSWTNCPWEGGLTIIVFSSRVCPFLQKILDSLHISSTCYMKKCSLQHRE